jgi:hypothetical protein
MPPYLSELLAAFVLAGACIAAITITSQAVSLSGYARIIDPSRPGAAPRSRGALEHHPLVEALEPVSADSLIAPWEQYSAY